LVGRNDDVDVSVSALIEGVIGDACCVDTKRPQLVPPGYGRVLILERTDGLPPFKPWVPDRNCWVFHATAGQAKASHRLERSRLA